jgi:predicted acylesterase/phospholipase RssA
MACTTVLTRAPAPADTFEVARPYGIEGDFVRLWGDSFSSEKTDAIVEARVDALRRVHAAEIAEGRPIESAMLALSGGGADGAFGAGLLAGWTARGDRPDFKIVTGVSTGAIVGLFAYLGPDYDYVLREIYTEHGTRDLLTPAIFTGLLRGAALTDTSGFRRLIERYVDETVVERLAEEHAAGKLLLIGTTNLDASRSVLWNIGEIAASGDPEALRLIRRVIEASAAIPGAFEPVILPVEIDGRKFDELHVDGAASRQLLLYSAEFDARRIDAALGVPLERRLFLIVNNRLDRAHEPVAPRLRPIMTSAISSLITNAGIGDVVTLYAVAERSGAQFNIISIPTAFDRTFEEPFDRAYMRELYAFGFEMGRDGTPWRDRPPGFPAR